MTIVPLPLFPQQEFRALFGFVLMDDAIIDTARLEGRLACDADSANPQEEIDGSATVLDFVPPHRPEKAAALAAARGGRRQG